MSAPAQPSNAEADTSDPVDKQTRLKRYLMEKASDGEVYFKSKFIADDVGLTPKEIGALMVNLRQSASDLEIEKWSYTGATTWRIARA